MKLKGIFQTSLKKKINLILGSKKSKEEIFDELEELLVLSDISMSLVQTILSNLRKKIKLTFERDDFYNALNEELRNIFSSIKSNEVNIPESKNIMMLVGINGSGKTTTAAKLSFYYKQRGKKVILCASDTFRAAGGFQLYLWGEKLGIPVIRGDMGTDPGAVVFNSLSSLRNKDFDMLIIDTAGRVQTRDNLMKELEKLTKIVKKQFPSQPSETFLIVDATMGQNTLDQAKKFSEFTGITGIILAKIDGTAKGGTVLNIIHELKIPVKFAGTGENEMDIVEFSYRDFIDTMLSD